MKNSIFFSLLIAVMSVLTACSKDIAPGQEQTAFDVVFNGINIPATYGTTTPIYTTQLANVLSSANKDKASSVKAVDIQNGKSYISVQGDGVGSLQNVTIDLLDGPDFRSKVVKSYNLNLNSFDSNEIEDSTNPCIAFLSSIADYLSMKKGVNIRVTLNAGAQDITNLKVTVHITAIFSW